MVLARLNTPHRTSLNPEYVCSVVLGKSRNCIPGSVLPVVPILYTAPELPLAYKRFQDHFGFPTSLPLLIAYTSSITIWKEAFLFSIFALCSILFLL